MCYVDSGPRIRWGPCCRLIEIGPWSSFYEIRNSAAALLGTVGPKFNSLLARFAGERIKQHYNITNDYNFVTIFPYNVNNFLPYNYL